MHNGRAQEIGLGGYAANAKEPDELTLAKAPVEAAHVWAEVKGGRNIVSERKAAKTGRIEANRQTLEKLAWEVHKHRSSRRNRKGFALTEKTHALWPARLESPVFKVIGTEPVAQIDVKAIRRVVHRLWHDKPEPARKIPYP